MICGLFFVSGFNIVDGNAFTYEPMPEATISMSLNQRQPTRRRTRRFRRQASSTSDRDIPRKIVDVFTVRSILPGSADDSIWDAYTKDLHHLLHMMRAGQRREARGELALRAGQTYQNISSKSPFLLPISIEIDNATPSCASIRRTPLAFYMSLPTPWH
jgi:hypothetical protein